ncbi:MAG: (d)CMP kinase [Armatimonadetes bacterium]|nr:(d)CMP kinase [Armatimonadota bacterium]
MASCLRIAIDGTASSGKSTVARLLARRLGILFLDTGAMYRALTWKALRQGVPLEDGEGLARMAEETEMIIRPVGETVRIELDGEVLGEDLLSPEISRGTALLATVSAVRRELVRLQRQQAERGSVVMVGRDIGTVVLPQAELKIFLVADLLERARRRWEELGKRHSLEEVERELSHRDRQDQEREDSPLVPASDAHVLDSTRLTPGQIVDRIIELLEAQKAS